jgi:hypothetical protein
LFGNANLGLVKHGIPLTRECRGREGPPQVTVFARCFTRFKLLRARLANLRRLAVSRCVPAQGRPPISRLHSDSRRLLVRSWPTVIQGSVLIVQRSLRQQPIVSRRELLSGLASSGSALALCGCADLSAVGARRLPLAWAEDQHHRLAHRPTNMSTII